MKTLKRIRYYTANSWNRSMAPAYNLKIYNVINNDLQDRVFELMECRNFCNVINDLIEKFDKNNDYKWQAGFNGRSDGYLVLYKGGCKKKTYTKKDFEDNHEVYISDFYGWTNYKKAKELNLINREIITKIFSYPGKNIDEEEVPVKVLKSFRKLAVDIVKEVERMAKEAKIGEIPSDKTIKILL